VEETFSLLAAEAEGVAVILHCFSGTTDEAAEAAERGWYCSFAGNLTYKRNDELREAARVVPRELLLVETDAPFLAPDPYRGKPNAPALVVYTARTLAQVHDCSEPEMFAVLTANARRAFTFPGPGTHAGG
jgi:TatD DNase family protein